ncbi:hypothetical protein [Bacillus sp. 1P06AnD]|uniref:hypothetical protein n=1 Tax=Bacillus sp. 1P06AnD TaxID=3132208 RepID=UPI0039A3B8BA
MGNFIIDSLVVIVCFYLFKPTESNHELKMFYKKSIWKVWIYGFTADMCGAFMLLIIGLDGQSLGFSYEMAYAVCYDPFSHPVAVMIILFSMFISAFFIFVFNYFYTYKKTITDKGKRLKVALAIAVLMIPWTFLFPAKWFY